MLLAGDIVLLILLTARMLQQVRGRRRAAQPLRRLAEDNHPLAARIFQS
jgi:hypothetical protein